MSERQPLHEHDGRICSHVGRAISTHFSSRFLARQFVGDAADAAARQEMRSRNSRLIWASSAGRASERTHLAFSLPTPESRPDQDEEEEVESHRRLANSLANATTSDAAGQQRTVAFSLHV